jgi:5-methyltetrahydropteroyltriglutamate--homocysteine methyltransferase
MALREARAQHAAGTLSAEALRQIEDRYIREAIGMQEEIGLQAVTDGEYRRAFWHYDFLAGLDGVEMVEVATGIQFSGGVQVRPVAPAVTSRLDYTTDHMVQYFGHFLSARGAQTRPHTGAMW